MTLSFLLIIVLYFSIGTSKLLSKTFSTQSSKNFLRVRSSAIGEYIIDSKGMALYIFEGDAPNKNKCTGECAQIWTPLSAEGFSFPPDVDSRLDTSYVGLIRTGAKYQVTYKKRPLYRFNLDKEKTDRKGHRLRDFGALWSLIKLDGTPLDTRISSAGEKILNPNKVIFTSTGFSSILVTPNLFQVKINITESNVNSTQAFQDFKNNLNNLNSSVASLVGNSKITYLERKINFDMGIFSISQILQTYSDDYKQIFNLTSKINELNANLNNKVTYSVTFSVSSDQLNNAKSLIYSRAIKDATENAELLLKHLSLVIDKGNPIKAINLDSNENLSQAISPLPSIVNSILLSLKAIVSYNIKTV